MIDSASTLGLRTNAYSSMFVPRDGISTIPLLIECYDSCAYPGEYIITRKKKAIFALIVGNENYAQKLKYGFPAETSLLIQIPRRNIVQTMLMK